MEKSKSCEKESDLHFMVAMVLAKKIEWENKKMWAACISWVVLYSLNDSTVKQYSKLHILLVYKCASITSEILRVLLFKVIFFTGDLFHFISKTCNFKTEIWIS